MNTLFVFWYRYVIMYLFEPIRRENTPIYSHARRTEHVNRRNGAYGVNFGKQEHVMRKICKQFGVGRGRADKRGRTRRSIFVDEFFAASRRRGGRGGGHMNSAKNTKHLLHPPHRSWISRVYRYTVHCILLL